MKATIAIWATALLFGLGACGGDDDSGSGSGGTDGPAATVGDGGEPSAGGGGSRPAGSASGRADRSMPRGATIEAAASDYGTILFDEGNQAIYLFDKEEGRRSECYGACAEAWPPVLTEGEPRAAAGANTGLLGTTRRDDGTTQITYGGHPLYYYAHEEPGQVLCHNVAEFGGLWLVVTPEGNPVS
jgi:predicted lipoprotein with Yx(FWY)xxD motif